MAREFEKAERGIKLFTIRGIELRLDYSWFIVFALVLFSLSLGYFPQAYPDQPSRVYWITGLIATLLFFVSVVTHELAHSFMALRSGMEIHGITLFIFGGMARLSEEAGDPETEFKIAVVGPLTSLLLAVLFWLAQIALRGGPPTIAVEMLGYLAVVNVALALFNLVPGFPLDGGRLLRAFWWWKTGSVVKATRVAADWGKGFAIALMVLGGLQIFAGSLIGGLWLIFIGMFLRGMAEASYHEVVSRKVLEGARVAQVMERDVVSVPADLPVTGVIADYFLRYGYRAFPVRADGAWTGWISLAEVRNLSPERREERTVGEIMAPLDGGMIIAPETPVADALRRMRERNLSRLLVAGRRDEILGMITQTAILRYLDIYQTIGPDAAVTQEGAHGEGSRRA